MTHPMNSIRSKLMVTAFATALLAVGASGCTSDSTNAASNRGDASTDTTTSRMGQGTDAGTEKGMREAGPLAQNSVQAADTTQSAQTTTPSTMNDGALTGDVTQDTSAVQDVPLNTSPSAVNGLPPAGEARETTSGTTSGAIVTEERVEKRKTKKKMKKANPASTQSTTEQSPMEAPAN